jgi:hypothetical protein
METDTFELIEEWIAKWDDLTDFDITPVIDSPTKSDQQGGAADNTSKYR